MSRKVVLEITTDGGDRWIYDLKGRQTATDLEVLLGLLDGSAEVTNIFC